MPVTINGTTGVSLVAANGVPTVAIQDDAVTAAKFNDDASQLFGFRNRIINGAMEIDQRNAGASVTVNNSVGGHGIDRWYYENNSGSGVYTYQQVADAPAGLKNSLKITVTTADATLNATDRALIAQRIEGLNTIDFAWGTASAKTATLSFWAKSSLTGTYGGVIANNAANRSYPFTYTIDSANTWEYKTIIITGETSGTWATNTDAGIIIIWGLGVGTTYSGTANAWASSQLLSATGGINLIGTLNATWQITAVQFEIGSVATPFEKRPYGLELSLCQRYYYKQDTITTWFFTISTVDTYKAMDYRFPVPMRGGPTCTIIGSGTNGTYAASYPQVTATTAYQAQLRGDTTTAGVYSSFTGFTASAEF